MDDNQSASKRRKRSQKQIVEDSISLLKEKGYLDKLSGMADWQWFGGQEEVYSADRVQEIADMAEANREAYNAIRTILEKEYNRQQSLKKAEDKIVF